MADVLREKELAERDKNEPIMELADDHPVRRLISRFRKMSYSRSSSGNVAGLLTGADDASSVMNMVLPTPAPSPTEKCKSASTTSGGNCDPTADETVECCQSLINDSNARRNSYGKNNNNNNLSNNIGNSGGGSGNVTPSNSERRFDNVPTIKIAASLSGDDSSVLTEVVPVTSSSKTTTPAGFRRALSTPVAKNLPAGRGVSAGGAGSQFGTRSRWAALCAPNRTSSAGRPPQSPSSTSSGVSVTPAQSIPNDRRSSTSDNVAQLEQNDATLASAPTIAPPEIVVEELKPEPAESARETLIDDPPPQRQRQLQRKWRRSGGVSKLRKDSSDECVVLAGQNCPQSPTSTPVSLTTRTESSVDDDNYDDNNKEDPELVRADVRREIAVIREKMAAIDSRLDAILCLMTSGTIGGWNEAGSLAAIAAQPARPTTPTSGLDRNNGIRRF